MNMIIYFVLSIFLKVILKKKNFQTLKEKLQRKVTKMRYVIMPIQPNLPGLQFMKGTFHTKMAIVAKAVLSDCSFPLDVFFGLFFKTLMSIRLYICYACFYNREIYILL